jgi:hypothetical protein
MKIENASVINTPVQRRNVFYPKAFSGNGSNKKKRG